MLDHLFIMASSAFTMLDFMNNKTWAFMQTDKYINPLFRQVLPSLDILEELSELADFTFAPGLADILSSPTPPSLDFFESLKLPKDKVWGIYVLVLKKNGK